METPIEEQIWRLVQALEKINDNREATAAASAATANLRQLVATGVFGSLTGSALALMQVIVRDPRMKDADRIVANALLTAFDPGLGYASLSKPQICARTGFSESAVRLSLRRLVAAGYFVATQPTQAEWAAGDTALRHRPQFAE